MAFTAQYLAQLETQMALLASGEATSVNINGKAYTIENLGALQSHYDWVREKIQESGNGAFVKVKFVDKRKL